MGTIKRDVPMTKTELCPMCRFSDQRLVEFKKPKFKFSDEFITGKRLTTYCLREGNYKQKLILKCVDYKPRAGKIGKKLYQNTL